MALRTSRFRAIPAITLIAAFQAVAPSSAAPDPAKKLSQTGRETMAAATAEVDSAEESPAAATNTTCAAAAAVACNGSVAFDNSTILNSPSPEYGCVDPLADPDGTLWYKFVATNTSARIHTCNSFAEDSVFAVYDACGSSVEIGRAEDNCGASTYLGDDCVSGLTIGQTYFIQVSAWVPVSRGQYALEIECPCPAAPENIECSTAQEIPCNSSVTFDNSGLGNPPLPCYSCGGGFAHDGTLWFRFTPPGTSARISTCRSAAQDSTMAVYGGACDGLTEMGCSEDVCGLSSYLSDTTVTNLVPGQPYFIQVSAWHPGEAGSYTLDLQCASACPPSSAPQPELLRNNAGSLVPSAKNRTLSFTAGDSGRNQAVRVALANLPSSYDAWNGRELYLGDPTSACEVAAIGLGGTCPAGAPTFTSASLNCSPTCRTDWSQFAAIHARHEAIVPGGVYQVDVVGCECDLGDPESYSPSLSINTARWGDMTGNFVGGVWAAPDGSISVTTDVVAGLEKFGNRTGAPIKARADVEPACLDLKINIPDTVRILDAFRGILFPFSPTVADPCQSPCP